MGCTASTVAVEPLSTDMAKELDPNEILLALIFTKQMIEKGELTEGKAIHDSLGFLLRQMLAQHERDKRRQGNHEQVNELSPRHPIIQMLILLKAFRPGMMMDVREIIARLHFIILAIIEDRNEQGGTEFTPPVASPSPEQARIPIDQRTPQQKASDVEDVLNWVRNPTEDSIQTEPFKRIAELLPPKKLGGTPQDRANDIDNTLTWLRNRGVDDSNISVPDSRSPQQKDKDLEDIAEWVRNPREHDSPERQPMIRCIRCLDPLLPKKPGQPPEDRAKDLDLALRWIHNRGVDDSVRSNTEERTRTGGLAAIKLIFEGQKAGTVPMRLDFDKSEFERQVDPEYIANAQFTPEQENEVLQALKTHHPLLDLSSGTECSAIAAQFKNSSMKTSALTPKEIEAILTRIVDKQETSTLPDNVPVKVSFSDDDFMFGPGIRVFSFKRVAAPPSTGTETDPAEESTAKVKKIKKKSAGTKKEVEGSKSKKKKVKKRSPGTGNGDEESKAKKKKVKAAEQDVDTEAQKSKLPSGSTTKSSGSSEDGGVDSTNTNKKKKKKKKVAVNSEPKKKRSEPKAER